MKLYFDNAKHIKTEKWSVATINTWNCGSLFGTLIGKVWKNLEEQARKSLVAMNGALRAMLVRAQTDEPWGKSSAFLENYFNSQNEEVSRNMSDKRHSDEVIELRSKVLETNAKSSLQLGCKEFEEIMSMF